LNDVEEPITATAVIFQTDGCKPPEFSELSGKGGGHLMNLSSLTSDAANSYSSHKSKVASTFWL
jgi:hypothetical protein